MYEKSFSKANPFGVFVAFHSVFLWHFIRCFCGLSAIFSQRIIFFPLCKFSKIEILYVHLEEIIRINAAGKVCPSAKQLFIEPSHYIYFYTISSVNMMFLRTGLLLNLSGAFEALIRSFSEALFLYIPSRKMLTFFALSILIGGVIFRARPNC
ncbi:hypothetical protein HQ29_09630 [Porphyromonas canoris]|nr:hypothetical protein HQ29_09630 [Porphyromonas canoris]